MDQVCTQLKIRTFFSFFLDVITHDYDINYFYLQWYLGHQNIRMYSFGSKLWVVCYIIVHPSIAMLFVLLKSLDFLLSKIYLQNIITTLTLASFPDLRCHYHLIVFLNITLPMQLFWSHIHWYEAWLFVAWISTCSSMQW